MIFAFLARIGVPQRFQALVLWLGLAAVLALCVALWFRAHDRKVIDRHEAGIEKRVTEATNAANDKADQAVTGTQTKVEQGNDDARDAAIGSDDPLRAGFDSLRKGAGSSRPSAR